MTSSGIHICILKQHNKSTFRQNKHTQRHLMEAEKSISNCENWEKYTVNGLGLEVWIGAMTITANQGHNNSCGVVKVSNNVIDVFLTAQLPPYCFQA